MITLNGVIIFPCTFFVLSFMLSFLGCYHLCYYLMLSFDVIIWCYNFSRSTNVIIFMLLFSLVHILCYHLCYHLMLSFIVIISPLFFFFLKTWHTQIGVLCRVRPHFRFGSEIWNWSENFVSLRSEKKVWFHMIHFDAKHQKSEAKTKVK